MTRSQERAQTTPAALERTLADSRARVPPPAPFGHLAGADEPAPHEARGRGISFLLGKHDDAVRFLKEAVSILFDAAGEVDSGESQAVDRDGERAAIGEDDDIGGERPVRARVTGQQVAQRVGHRLGEAGPAGAGVELGVGREQLRAAGAALEQLGGSR